MKLKTWRAMVIYLYANQYLGSTDIKRTQMSTLHYHMVMTVQFLFTTVRCLFRGLYDFIGNLQKYLHFLWWLSCSGCWWWHIMHVQCQYSRYSEVLVSYTHNVFEDFAMRDSSQLWKWGVWSRFHLCWGEHNPGELPANGGDTTMLPETGSTAEWNRPTGFQHQCSW